MFGTAMPTGHRTGSGLSEETHRGDAELSKPWRHRLIAGVTMAILATGLPVSATAAPKGAGGSATLVNIMNGGWADTMLCASPDDTNVWMGNAKSAEDPYCKWEQVGNDGQFTFFNPAKGMVLTASGDNALTMADLIFPTPATQSFTWGAPEAGDARALQWYGNRSLYVDGGIDAPTPDPVRLRGWRDDHHQQSWAVRKTDPPKEAQPVRAASAVYVMNGLWPDHMLCADIDDNTVRLSVDKTNEACEWLPFGSGSFVLYNPKYGKVITYAGGNAGPLVLDNLLYPSTNSELWSLAGAESWGSSALQWYGDQGQNVDAGIGSPTTGPVHTRGWRDGNQMQLTWNFVRVNPPTALVTLGDSFMSGEAGRWQGNSNNFLLSRDGTDRAYTGWQTYDPSIVYGSSYTNGCNRSDSAEAHSSSVMEVQVNLACSGATTANVFPTNDGGQPFKGESPQADQLLWTAKKYDVRVIALSIGGNDLGFSDIISACVYAYTTGGKPCNPVQQEHVDNEMGRTMKNVARAIRDIRDTMKLAGYDPHRYRIILQSAPSPLPRAKEIRYEEKTWERLHTGGCPIWNEDADWARDKLVGQISNNLEAVAESMQVDFLDLRDALQDREVCATRSELVDGTHPPSATTSEWARFLVSGQVQGQLQESFHPNYYGQLALGKCLSLIAADPNIRRAACNNTPGEGPSEMYLGATP